MRSSTICPSRGARSRPRVLILIVAYNAETTICEVLRRIPAKLSEVYESLATLFNITQEEQSQMLPSGTQRRWPKEGPPSES